jgi:hypothetical protein
MCPRSPRRFLFVLLPVLGFGVACREKDPPPPPPAASAPAKVALDPGVRLQASPAEMRAALDRAYRLELDRRFVTAAALVHQIVSGKPRSPATAEFTAGKWTIRHQAVEVGALPELADFGEAFALLTAWAARVAKENAVELEPGGEAASQLLVGDMAFEAIARAGAAWKGGDRKAATLHAAAHGLVSLTFQAADRMETADDLAAGALAALAAHRALTQAASPRGEALLAEAMGYRASAARAAEALPAGDALRDYLGRADARLEQAASAANAPTEARYLWLRRLLERDDRRAAAFAQRAFAGLELGLPVLAARLAAPRVPFDDERTLGRAVPAITLMSAARASGSKEADLASSALKSSGGDGQGLERAAATILERMAIGRADILPRFEAELAKLPGPDESPLTEGSARRAYLRALFCSGFSVLATHYLDSLSSGPASKAFLEDIGSGSGPLGADFRQWYEQLVASSSGARVTGELLGSMKSLPSFGAAPAMRVLDELFERADWADPVITSAVKRLVARMDSRVAHRRELAQIAWSGLVDLRLAERLYADLARVAPGQYEAQEVWFAGLHGDAARLKEHLQRESLAPAARAKAIRALEKAGGLDRAGADAERAKLLAAEPHGWSARDVIVDDLEEDERYEDARAVITPWLAAHTNDPGLAPIFARTAIARMLYRMGRHDEGLTVITPVLSSKQFGAMQRGALLLAARGKKSEAEALARAALERYPGTNGAALLAEVQWRNGEIDAAAAGLNAPPRPIPLLGWRGAVGGAFAEVFAGRPAAEGLAAFAALKKAGVEPAALGELAKTVKQRKAPELAFEMLKDLTFTRGSDLPRLILAFSALEQWKGREEALGWLRSKVPPAKLPELGQHAFTDKHDALLWDLVPDPTTADDTAAFTWLMRASVSMRTPPSDAQREALKRHFDGDGVGHYHAIGRYLVGKGDIASIVALAKDERKAGEIAFYLGLAAQGAKRYEEASDWYRAAVETGQTRLGEYRWAYNQLRAWQAANKSLSRLQKEGL